MQIYISGWSHVPHSYTSILKETKKNLKGLYLNPQNQNFYDENWKLSAPISSAWKQWTLAVYKMNRYWHRKPVPTYRPIHRHITTVSFHKWMVYVHHRALAIVCSMQTVPNGELSSFLNIFTFYIIHTLEHVTIMPLLNLRWRTASQWCNNVLRSSPVLTSQTLTVESLEPLMITFSSYWRHRTEPVCPVSTCQTYPNLVDNFIWSKRRLVSTNNVPWYIEEIAYPIFWWYYPGAQKRFCPHHTAGSRLLWSSQTDNLWVADWVHLSANYFQYFVNPVQSEGTVDGRNYCPGKSSQAWTNIGSCGQRKNIDLA